MRLGLSIPGSPERLMADASGPAHTFAGRVSGCSGGRSAPQVSQHSCNGLHPGHTQEHTRAHTGAHACVCMQVRAYDAAVHWGALRAPETEEEVAPAFAGLTLAARRPLPPSEDNPQVRAQVIMCVRACARARVCVCVRRVRYASPSQGMPATQPLVCKHMYICTRVQARAHMHFCVWQPVCLLAANTGLRVRSGLGFGLGWQNPKWWWFLLAQRRRVPEHVRACALPTSGCVLVLC